MSPRARVTALVSVVAASRRPRPWAERSSRAATRAARCTARPPPQADRAEPPALELAVVDRDDAEARALRAAEDAVRGGRRRPCAPSASPTSSPRTRTRWRPPSARPSSTTRRDGRAARGARRAQSRERRRAAEPRPRAARDRGERRRRRRNGARPSGATPTRRRPCAPRISGTRTRRPAARSSSWTAFRVTSRTSPPPAGSRSFAGGRSRAAPASGSSSEAGSRPSGAACPRSTPTTGPARSTPDRWRRRSRPPSAASTRTTRPGPSRGSAHSPRENPKSALVRFHLGLLLLWLPNVEEARRQLGRAEAEGGFYGGQAARILQTLDETE